MDMNKQEQMYCDIVHLVADIAKEGFGIDIVHNPLFSGVFKQQLERHHQKLVMFVCKYVPVEPPPVVNPPIEVVQPELQPVRETLNVPSITSINQV